MDETIMETLRMLYNHETTEITTKYIGIWKEESKNGRAENL